MKPTFFTAFILAIFINFSSIYNNIPNTKETVTIGDRVPNFSLTDNLGNSFNSKEFIGKQPVVIFFFSQKKSATYTNEIASFKNQFDEFKRLNIKFIGISTANVMSLNRLYVKNKLPFKLLTDHKKRVYDLFDVRNSYSKKKQITFIVNKKGILTDVLKDQNKTHAIRVLERLTNSI